MYYREMLCMEVVKTGITTKNEDQKVKTNWMCLMHALVVHESWMVVNKKLTLIIILLLESSLAGMIENRMFGYVQNSHDRKIEGQNIEKCILYQVCENWMVANGT